MLNLIAMRNIFVAVVVLQSCSVALAASAQPNIVVIFSDDHAYQAISAYGENRKLLSTPNIDRIGNKGVRFDRCLVTNSICGPSRAVILTGKYSHKNGFYDNGNVQFDGSQNTFIKELRLIRNYVQDRSPRAHRSPRLNCQHRKTLRNQSQRTQSRLSRKDKMGQRVGLLY